MRNVTSLNPFSHALAHAGLKPRCKAARTTPQRGAQRTFLLRGRCAVSRRWFAQPLPQLTLDYTVSGFDPGLGDRFHNNIP